MSLYPTKAYPITKGLSEFEILKASHKFLREDDTPKDENENETSTRTSANANKTWEDKLAEKYYENLYREFAVCDLKHYKSGNFALRWRTESEVLSGAGESTCGNTRCKYHYSSSESLSRTRKKEPQLTTLELPFAYVEHGEAKSALVKVVLCPRCVKKLMWKRRKDKERAMAVEKGETEQVDPALGDGNGVSESEDSENEVEELRRKGKRKEREREMAENGHDAGTEPIGEKADKDSRAHSRGTHEVEDCSRKQRHRNDNFNNTDHEGKSRNRSSRSRSPRRRHHSHPHHLDDGFNNPGHEDKSRRRGSRSRSPRQRHHSHPHNSPHSSSRKRSRSRDHDGGNI